MIDPRITIRGMSEREHEAGGDGVLSLLHQLAGYVVDACNVIGIHRVTQPKTVGKKSGSQENRKMAKRHDGPNSHSTI